MAVTFEGARDTAYNYSWEIAREMTPDEELSTSNTLKILRQRSKQLIKDNPIVSGAQQAYVNLICNAGPVVYSSSTSRIQRDQVNTFLSDALEKIDITSTKSLAKILEEIVTWSFADGDILINLPLDSKRTGVKTVVELIEAQRISTPAPYQSKKGSSKNVQNGVELSAEGRILGYWVKKCDKVGFYSDAVENFDFYPMYRKGKSGYERKVTYLFKAPLNARPKMSRQYPVIASCIAWFKHLHDYMEATIVGARVAACFSAFIVSKNPAGTWAGMTTDTSDGSVRNDPTGGTTRRATKLQPGQIFYMRPNEEINFSSPNRPSDNVDSFMLRIYKTIAMALRVPYPLLFLDMAEVSYSSWRGAAIEAVKMIGRWRRDLTSVIKWIVDTLIAEGIIRGEIRGDVKGAKIKVRWPAHGILDPEKEARANKVRLTNGTVSKQMITDESGIDYDELQEEIEEEAIAAAVLEAKVLLKKKELEKEMGIVFPENKETDKVNRQTPRRPGEEEGEDLDEDDAKERRKEDGNY